MCTSLHWFISDCLSPLSAVWFSQCDNSCPVAPFSKWEFLMTQLVGEPNCSAGGPLGLINVNHQYARPLPQTSMYSNHDNAWLKTNFGIFWMTCPPMWLNIDNNLGVIMKSCCKPSVHAISLSPLYFPPYFYLASNPNSTSNHDRLDHNSVYHSHSILCHLGASYMASYQWQCATVAKSASDSTCLMVQIRKRWGGEVTLQSHLILSSCYKARCWGDLKVIHLQLAFPSQ